MCYGFDGDGAVTEAFERRGHQRPSRGLGRRGFLGAVAGTAVAGAAASVGSASPAAAAADLGAGRRRVPPGRISIQMYSVRADLETNYRRTARYVANAGYRNVEQAGLYDMTAKQVRRIHDNLGLHTTSSHDGLSADRDALMTKLDNAATLGQKYIVVPGVNSDDPEQWRRWAWQMNSEGYAAKKHGMHFGYHNHTHEFIELSNGQRPWDIFCEELDPDLVHFEADLCWVVAGGIESGDGAEDPEGFAIQTIREAPLKVRQFHVKDRDPQTGDTADLGRGNIDFKRIFAAHTAEEYIMENDTPDVTPKQTATVGYDYLLDIRY